MLLNARHNPAKTLSVLLHPSALPAAKPIIVVSKICTLPVIKATFPTSFTTLGFNPRPIINKSKAMPMLAKTSMTLSLSIILRAKGPTITPVNI